MLKSIIHITAGHGGGFEMVKRIARYLDKCNIENKIICIKENSEYISLNAGSIFDEDLISFRVLKKIKRETLNSNIIFYHNVSNFSSLIIITYLRLILNKNIACVFHSNLDGPGSFLRKLFYLIRKFFILHFLLLLIPKLVFVSQSQKSCFEKICIFKKKMSEKALCNYNFISNEKKNEIVKKFSRMQALFVGRFTYFKGFHHLLYLADELKENSIISFHIIGDGELKDKIEASSSNIIYHGRVPSVHINKYYDQCNVLIFPTYTESFGLVVIEAMSHGLVILASDIPVMREIIEVGKNGFLFPPGDIKKMRELVLYCSENPMIMKKISKNNIKDSRRFTEAKLGSNYLNLYKQLLNLV